uniref:Kit ligand n=1 Tax=Neogobius melanostomus TaxID=47308 RepID=A0A8C6S6Y3_9GOBI
IHVLVNITMVISCFVFQRQNIPKDYKIPVHYIRREEGGMCWVKLNIYYLEESLKDLSHKFGNISSNRKDISILIEMLQGSRIKMGSLEPIMFDFQCHFRKDRWPTALYFDFVKDFLTAAQLKEFSDDCEPPPCPTTQQPTTTTIFWQTTSSTKRIMSEVLERSLLSLLFIPLLAIIFLLFWKLRSRRNAQDLEQSPAQDELFAGTEGSAPPTDADTSEK